MHSCFHETEEESCEDRYDLRNLVPDKHMQKRKRLVGEYDTTVDLTTNVWAEKTNRPRLKIFGIDNTMWFGMRTLQ